MRRKFDAVGSAGGNVSGVVVGGAGGVVSPGADESPARRRVVGGGGRSSAAVGRVGDVDDVAGAHDHVAGDERAGGEEAGDRR